MAINADKPHLWKADISASVDLFNRWFLRFAPKAFRDTRIATTESVKSTLRDTNDLKAITPKILAAHPEIISTLRMATCPPIARDRLIGLAGLNKNLVMVMEAGKLPVRMKLPELRENLKRMIKTIKKMLDVDIFPWISAKTEATEEQRHRASTIVADRLCGAISDPIIRNAQEQRQLALVGKFLGRRGYMREAHPAREPLAEMKRGTFAFRAKTTVRNSSGGTVNMPVDIIIQPLTAQAGDLPILIEAKSAGDFTNTNKRRKEEATKIHQLRTTHGESVRFLLFLCGYFDTGYLGYEAAEGIDWIWEHRIEDMDQLGI